MKRRSGGIDVALYGELGRDEPLEKVGRHVEYDHTDATASADADVLFAPPERLHEVVAAGIGVPILPVGDTQHPLVVSVDRAFAFARDARCEGIEIETHPTLDVTTDGEPLRCATSEAALVTAETARISEFGVDTESGSYAYRADGITVATPFGSHGYTRAAGGPIVAPGGGTAVAPIAPFAIDAGPRVETLPIALSIERDDEIDVIVDGSIVRTISSDTTVEIERGRTLPIVRPCGGRDWKNSNESSTESVS